MSLGAEVKGVRANVRRSGIMVCSTVVCLLAPSLSTAQERGAYGACMVQAAPKYNSPYPERVIYWTVPHLTPVVLDRSLAKDFAAHVKERSGMAFIGNVSCGQERTMEEAEKHFQMVKARYPESRHVVTDWRYRGELLPPVQLGSSSSTSSRPAAAAPVAGAASAAPDPARSEAAARRRDSIAAVATYDSIVNAQQQRAAESERQAAAGAQAAIGMLDMISANNRSIAEHNERVRAEAAAARARAEAASRPRRMALMRAVGPRPACGRNDQTPTLKIGSTYSGRITGYECRIAGDLSAVVHRLDVPKGGIIEVRIANAVSSYYGISSRTGVITQSLVGDPEVQLTAGTHYLTVAPALPGDTGWYRLTVRTGTKSETGAFTLSPIGYMDSYSSDSDRLGGSRLGSGFRLAMGWGFFHAFGSYSATHGARDQIKLESMGGGARLYAMGRRSQYRPFFEYAINRLDGTYAEPLELYAGNASSYGLGVEMFWYRFGVEASYNLMNMKLKSDETPEFKATGKRLQIALSAHIF